MYLDCIFVENQFIYLIKINKINSNSHPRTHLLPPPPPPKKKSLVNYLTLLFNCYQSNVTLDLTMFISCVATNTIPRRSYLTKS